MDDQPPYLRIAGRIRQRIADGDLRPGDRVPSTRQIAREWGVALATATKALTALRLEGAVEARPRVGTVVAGTGAPATAPAPRRPAEPELTQARVVRAAIEIADAEGLAALSMRGVAARLGVAAMAPYRHVGGKDELVALMVDAAYGEVTHAGVPPEGWRARLEAGARGLWEVCRRHPWVAQVGPLTRPLVLPNLMAHAEWALAALEGCGLDAKTRFDIHLLVYSYVQGLAVNLEREAHARAATGLTEDEWMDGQEAAMRKIVGSGRHPALARTLAGFEDGYDLDLDALFDFGLEPLLDGIARLIEG
ncbi:GntR family transcriptional regulator [Streptomyces sp. WAC05374]|uniref:TetR/AcrR family transcriptional regulator C-terminal domain-containing protein n=1 Tax=Streptomyces sp. WAC05374 TaxID=2487420 RepID=UPI000F85C3CC|nr:TetR/AcrR family transcriptional regulator C-terminal domain-containing protein [Streptomyces sp. WAC05374]RST13946.1 GntR family transcriptional regulator [Streptomyces sp. WAC05374]TDF37114.1 GntR family transcriptional regulator [Streptomyces sp. WAC05374]TDF44895.1 GntR family transcriptional regulator [Streptomyces sp. WAC05374]TDF45771.1 GntR family transcriptional regulator [Streptomyces sp. WAC05374]